MGNEIIKLQKYIEKFLNGKSNIRNLEAGCGSASHVRFKNDCLRVCIDISEKQLERNSGLNEKILGDIQYYKFLPKAFDVIICWDVLEHIEKPTRVLNGFTDALRDNGILILALPNVLSLKGLITKYTSHRFHILFYRYIKGNKNAGKNDIGPFKTYMSYSISPNAITDFAHNKGLSVIYFDLYDGKTKSKRLIFKAYDFINKYIFEYQGILISLYFWGR